MRDVFTNLLISCPNNGGLFLLHQGATYKIDSLDTTGFVVDERRMLRALQPAQLVQFEEGLQEGLTSAADFDDIHDVMVDGNFSYVVKTDSNEIIKLDPQGREQQRWTLPGERDSWHVNCLARWNNRLVFSAFGDLRLCREYKEKSLGLGIVQDLETGEKLIGDLSQPHSLLATGENLLLANSATSEIREFDRGGHLLRSKKLDGYTRGILSHSGVLYVGLSRSRNVNIGSLANAVVVALDAESWDEIGRHPLPVKEIYSIQHVKDAVAVEFLAKLASHASFSLGEKVAALEFNANQQTEKMALAERQAAKLGAEIAIKDELLRGKAMQIQELDEAVREQERRVYGLLETVHGKDVHIRNREDIVRSKDLEIQRRDEVIYSKEREIQNRNEIIRCKEAEFRVRDETIQRLEKSMVESRIELSVRDKAVAESESRFAVQEEQIQVMDKDLQRKDVEIRDRDEAIREDERKIDGLLETIHGKDIHIRSREAIISDKDREIQRRETVHERDENRIATLTEERRHQEGAIERLRSDLDIHKRQIEDMRRNADAMHSKLQGVTNQLRLSRMQVRDMTLSRSWKLTRPMRALKLAFSARKETISNGIVKSPSSLRAHSDADLRMKPSAADSLQVDAQDMQTAPLLSSSIEDRTVESAVPTFFLHGSARPIVILTVPHCTYVAKEIQGALQRVEIQSRIIYKIPDSGYDDVPHFVICPQMFERLPDLYVSFQMEQSVSSRWFTEEYIKRLENSFAIMDYSLANIAKLQDMGLYAQQMYHVPIGFVRNYVDLTDAVIPEYDVIFYGDIQNARRREFIAELSMVCKVKVINDLFGESLHIELAKARLVVNIHYYAGALLETTRLWECLSLGKLVISERSVDMDQHADLNDLIDFVDVDDIAGMVERVRYWLGDEGARRERIEQNHRTLQDAPDQFDAHFYRFLLATDNITFDEFWNLAGQRMRLSSDRICLNLPEFVRRSESFDRDNRFGFVRFTGLRHSKGWVGCAMSYKLMIMLARSQGLPSVTICEDDVEFPKNFESRWPVIQQYLRTNPDDWDVFSGLMADVHTDIKVVSTHVRDQMQFLLTDRLISMVFNVYNASMFDAVASWDERNRDVASNTIDRYLERSRSLRILVTLPFLVGHKEELFSTLWGFQNTQYKDLISASSELLANKVIEHDERKAGG